MIKVPDRSDAAVIRAFFSECGYSDKGLTQALGRAKPPGRDELQLMLFLSREPTALNVLARLFLMGADVESAAAKPLLRERVIDAMLGCGMLAEQGDRYVPGVAVVPSGEFLVVSDAFAVLGSERASEFVLPASTHSADFLRQLIVPGRTADALDLGCGCGIHALYLSLQADRVVASDISERAISYAQFNAVLNNRDNIECIAGDRFAALGGRRFDLIVSNPPFVPGPSDEFTYRDSGAELDEFCASLLTEAAAHLNDGGHLQMLCEWVEVSGQPWQERVRSWVSETNCDTWILHSPPLRPGAYVRQRGSDIRRAQSIADQQVFDDWVLYFRERAVTAVHPGMILLRRRDGDHWFHVHDMASDLNAHAGQAILRSIEACDYLWRVPDEDLLEARLALSPFLELEQRFSRTENHWKPTNAMLKLTDGMAMEAEVDMPVLAFLNQLDGSRTLDEAIAKFAQAANASANKVRDDFVPIVKSFIRRGFISSGPGA